MIDPNEAPDGFVAVSPYKKNGHICSGCAFYKDDECQMSDSLCFPSWRKDGERVIFIPREASIFIPHEESNLEEFSAIGELAEAKAEIERWKSSHDHVCRKFADCENARDENARLCEEARDELKRWQDLAAKYSKEREHNANEALRWQAECRDRDGLIAKLKAQLTTALESIARMR